MWERHTQGYALALLQGGADMESRMPSPARLAPGGSWQGAGSKPSPPPMGEPGGHTRWRGTNTSLTSAAWLGGERSCLPPSATMPIASCTPQTFSGRPLGAQAWLDSSLLLRSTGLPHQPASQPASTGSASQDLQRPGPGGALAPALSSGPCPVPRPGAGGGGRFLGQGGRESEGGAGSHQLTPSSARALGSHVVVASRGRRGVWARGDGVTSFGGAGRGEGALCPLPGGQGRAAARAGRGARPVPPPRAESGPGGGRKRPPPPPRPQSAAPAPARGPPPRRLRGGSYLLPGAAARGPSPGGGGGGGCGWAGSLRGAGRRQ